jgi:hypothetical protein
MQNQLDLIEKQHNQLLEQIIMFEALAEKPPPSLIDSAKEFLSEISKTSAAVLDTNTRSFLNSLRHYWISYIYDHTGEFLSISLQPFTGSDNEKITSSLDLGIKESVLPTPESSARKSRGNSLEELKRVISSSEPIMVDENGCLISNKARDASEEVVGNESKTETVAKKYGSTLEDLKVRLAQEQTAIAAKKYSSILEDLKVWLAQQQQQTAIATKKYSSILEDLKGLGLNPYSNPDPIMIDHTGSLISNEIMDASGDTVIGNEPETETVAKRPIRTQGWYPWEDDYKSEIDWFAEKRGMTPLQSHSSNSGWLPKILNRLGLKKRPNKSKSLEELKWALSGNDPLSRTLYTEDKDVRDIERPVLFMATLLVEDSRHLSKKSAVSINKELKEATNLEQIREQIRQNANTFQVLLSDRTYIGREPHINEILVNDPYVSPVNTVLFYELSAESRRGIFRLIDAGSHNGTFVNGKRQENCILNENDIITVGKTRILFEFTRVNVTQW